MAIKKGDKVKVEGRHGEWKVIALERMIGGMRYTLSQAYKLGDIIIVAEDKVVRKC